MNTDSIQKKDSKRPDPNKGTGLLLVIFLIFWAVMSFLLLTGDNRPSKDTEFLPVFHGSGGLTYMPNPDYVPKSK
jgi:hypothetical protein